jgi:hypothetical protein
MKVLAIDQDAMRACRAHFAEGDLLGWMAGMAALKLGGASSATT